VAKFHFNWLPNQFTGLFQGADYGIVRISAAKQYDTTQAAAAGSFTPGMGVKMLRDNVPSANFVAMNQLQAQDSWNVFKYTWSNHVPCHNLDTALTALSKKFGTVSAWAANVGLSDMASIDQTGNTGASPVFPWSLLFVPNPALQSAFTDEFSQDFKQQLMTIPAGMDLYTVYAQVNPNEQAVQIGTMTLDSSFTTSQYGDETLFFKHQTFDEDVYIRSDWTATCATVTTCNQCPHETNCLPQ